MKLSPWAPGWMVDRGWYTLGWILHRLACVVGYHAWNFDPELRVPCFGTGHEQCLMCGLIKVKP